MAAGSFLLIEITEGFGIGTYVPDPASVKCVYIPYTGFDEQSQGELAYFDIYGSAPTKLTQPENIQTITELHSEYIEKRNNNELNNIYTQQLEVVYRLKSGKMVYRFISLDEDAMARFIKMDTTDDLRNARADAVETKLKELENKWNMQSSIRRSFPKK